MEVRFAHFTQNGKMLILINCYVIDIVITRTTTMKNIQRNTLKGTINHQDEILKNVQVIYQNAKHNNPKCVCARDPPKSKNDSSKRRRKQIYIYS